MGDSIMVKVIYLVLSIVGLILPYSQLTPFFLEQGLDIKLFVQQLFINRISACFGLDVIVSFFVLCTFIFWESMHLKMRNPWIYIACSFSVGVSFGLPLFLLMRQLHIEQEIKEAL
jgi:Terpene cyclase DEP1